MYDSIDIMMKGCGIFRLSLLTAFFNPPMNLVNLRMRTRMKW